MVSLCRIGSNNKEDAMSQENKLRIMLVEDHTLTRDAVRAVIQHQPDMTVVAESRTGEEAVAKAREAHPDVIVMDILLPGINGIQTTRKILTEQPGVKILGLSNHTGESLIRIVLAAGALGFVRKNKAFTELIPAIRSVVANIPYLSPVPPEPAP
jgi:DNA-binding NarL/FixJ family response regulator